MSSNTSEIVKITNLMELKKLVKRLSPDSSSSTLESIVIDTKKAGMADDKFGGSVTIPQTGSQSTLRQTVLDGFDMVKSHEIYYKASLAAKKSKDEYGGFMPAVVPSPDDHLTWLDTFINKNMGGKREGLHITWDIPEGSYRLDPWTCKLEKIDA